MVNSSEALGREAKTCSDLLGGQRCTFLGGQVAFDVVGGVEKVINFMTPLKITRWGFQIFFAFTPTWGRFPF